MGFRKAGVHDVFVACSTCMQPVANLHGRGRLDYKPSKRQNPILCLRCELKDLLESNPHHNSQVHDRDSKSRLSSCLLLLAVRAQLTNLTHSHTSIDKCRPYVHTWHLRAQIRIHIGSFIGTIEITSNATKSTTFFVHESRTQRKMYIVETVESKHDHSRDSRHIRLCTTSMK